MLKCWPSIAIGLVLAVNGAQAQFALQDQPVLPLWTQGLVAAVLPLHDGSVLVGGQFNAVKGIPKRNLARVLADGTLDPTFSCDANGRVSQLLRAPDGIYVRGTFTQLCGATRRSIGKLLPTGALNPQWDLRFVNTGDTVRSLALDGQGRLYIGGLFTSVIGPTGATQRGNLARLDAQGALDLNWTVRATGAVDALAVRADGKLWAGGDITQINAVSNGRLALLTTDDAGRADPAFANPNFVAGGSVVSLHVDTQGRLLIGGSFSGVGGQSRVSLARLNASGAVDHFSAQLSGGAVFSVTTHAGLVLAGGTFSQVQGQSRPFFAALNDDGQLSPLYPSRLRGPVLDITAESSAQIWLGGTFAAVNDRTDVSALAQIDPNGQVLRAGEFELPGSIRGLLADGTGVIAVGAFKRVGTTSRQYLARFLADGSLDPAWTLSADDEVLSIARDLDGDYYLGGRFQTIGLSQRAGLARIRADHTLDAAFQPGASGIVNFLEVGTSGALYAGGPTVIGGKARNLARMYRNGAVDLSFVPFINAGSVTAIREYGATVLIAGTFTSYAGESIANLLRVNFANADVDPSFTLRPNRALRALMPLANGELLIGGDHTGWNGSSDRRYLSRIDPTGTGTLISNFHAVNADDSVSVLARSGDRVFASIARRRVREFNLQTGTIQASSAISTDGDIFALAPAGANLFIAGGFGNVYPGGVISPTNARPRSGLAIVALQSGTQDAVFRNGFE